jgi:hypothetical protein
LEELRTMVSIEKKNYPQAAEWARRIILYKDGRFIKDKR